MSGDATLPRWAPRVRQSKIRRLYETDALGIYDDELIDDVGYALLARCRSFLRANEAVAGRAPCPRCRQVVRHNRRKEELLHCDTCGWELTWGEYFATIQHKQLSGAEPVLALFQQFVARFPSASTPRQKMLLIDQLIHGFHWSLKHSPTRPVAVKLIEGRLQEMIAFLDSLSYGGSSTAGVADAHDEWIERSQNARNWGGRGKPTASAP